MNETALLVIVIIAIAGVGLFIGGLLIIMRKPAWRYRHAADLPMILSLAVALTLLLRPGFIFPVYFQSRTERKRSI